MFKAPQKSLQSSWVSMAFKKPRKQGIYTIKKSLSSRATPILSYRGALTSHSTNHTY
jgi:hypothetical protein